MIKSSYLFYFLSLIKTKDTADEVMEKIDKLKESLYNKRVDLDKKMAELFTFEMKEKMKAYSLQEQVNLNDPESFGVFLSNLRGHIKNLAVVMVSIPFLKTDEIVSEISAWFVENFGKVVLIDLNVNTELVAGAVISFNGRELDFSLKKRIDQRYTPKNWDIFVDRVRGVKTKSDNFTPLTGPVLTGHPVETNTYQSL